MAIKRVLAGATEIKELITYEDETKESVGKGQAGQVLKTDGTNTYWGEGSSVSGKAVLSYTMSPDDVIQLSEEAKITINKYGVENIIFKINDGAGYTYYLELSELTDDPLYRYERIDLNNNLFYIALETDFSSITFIQISNDPIYYRPIVIEGTITGLTGESGDFGIENSVISTENYRQFIDYMAAPIQIENYIFQLEVLVHASGGGYNASYSYVYLGYKYYISIIWRTGGYIDETYGEQIGTQVSYTPTLTEGTKIGTININGTNTDLYAPEGGEGSVSLEPIEIGGTITVDDGENFVIQNPSITEDKYSQFLQNKNAPIKIGTQVFQLEDLSSSSNSYDATYTLLKYFYAFGDPHLYKIHITIVWAAGEGNSFLAQTFLRKENVVQDNPIILPGNDTGFTTENWSLTNVGVSQDNYQQFLKNKLSPVQIGDNVYQLNYLVQIAEDDYAAGYSLVSGKFTHCFYIRWEDENSSIPTYSTNHYASNGDFNAAINLVNGRIDDTNEDVEILNAKTQELYDKVFPGISNDPARIYELFYVDSSQTYYVRVNRALEEGGYIKLGQDPSDTSLSYYVYRPASTDNYWFSVGNYNDTMSRMTLVDEANSVYSFTIMSVLNGNKIQPSAEEETTLAYFVDIDAIGETPETGTSGTGLNIYPLSAGYLNFDNPVLSITASQVVEIKNANAISCPVEMTGLGQCSVILYICSLTTNYICFTDGMFIIGGQKFYVRRAYIDVAALTLNFTPDA